jgi:spoIIIJ-associated protein
MQSVEVEGKTVKEAIKKALEILKVSREEIDIQILSEEKMGLFGMRGSKPAKIRAILKNKKLDESNSHS